MNLRKVQLRHWAFVMTTASTSFGLAPGCNGCNPANQNFPHLDAAAEYPLPRGNVAFNTDVQGCPPAPTIVATPTAATVGEPVALMALLTSSDGGATTFTWSGAAGTGFFATLQGEKNTFVCQATGPAKLTLTATQGSCSTTRDLLYYCYGGGDAGVALGGRDGGVSGSGGTASGGTGGGIMGTGGSGATGVTGGSGAGGTGGIMMGSGGQPATGGAGAYPMLKNTCPATEPVPNTRSGATTTCGDCAAENCNFGPLPASDGCCGLRSVSDQDLCVAVLSCFIAHPEAIHEGDTTAEFCGTTPTSTCFSTFEAANGPCRTEAFAAVKANDPSKVNAQFTSAGSPLGRAVNLIGIVAAPGVCDDVCDVGPRSANGTGGSPAATGGTPAATGGAHGGMTGSSMGGAGGTAGG